MKNKEQRQVSRGRRGSNEAELVLVGVASGKSGNLWSVDTARGSRIVCVVDVA
jgi:hypothetical protein